MMWLMILALAAVLVLLFIFVLKPYLIRYDTVVAFTGGLGTGKSFLSVDTAVRLLKKNRFRTKFYNLLHRSDPLPIPQLYSSIPVLISRNEMSVVLDPDHLTLQSAIIPGSVVFLDEIDVWANQFSFGNENIIETQSKKDLASLRNGESDHDSGLFDEEVRLFRHLFSSRACECKLVCNSQATSNICTVVRRRMNTVYVLSTFRVWFKLFYTVKCRQITITDEITNTNAASSEDDMRTVIGLMPRYRRYDTHVYSGRAKSLAYSPVVRWSNLKTNRLLRAPIERLKNKSGK